MHIIHFEVFLHSIISLLSPPRSFSFVLLSSMDLQGTIWGMSWWIHSEISAMESRRQTGVGKIIKNEKNTPSKAKPSNIKSRGLGYAVFILAKALAHFPSKEREVQKNGENRSVEGAPVITSSSVLNQLEPSNVLTHLQQLCSVGVDILFQLVLYKVCKVTTARPKTNGHSS